MLAKWRATGSTTSRALGMRSRMIWAIATGVPWSSSPTMTRVGSSISPNRSVSAKADIAMAQPQKPSIDVAKIISLTLPITSGEAWTKPGENQRSMVVSRVAPRPLARAAFTRSSHMVRASAG